jgi:hypothetical protein
MNVRWAGAAVALLIVAAFGLITDTYPFVAELAALAFLLIGFHLLPLRVRNRTRGAAIILLILGITAGIFLALAASQGPLVCGAPNAPPC